MAGYDKSRDADERLLLMLRRRSRGWTPTQIARLSGGQLSPANVETIMKRILAADLKESGEPEAIVRAAYWTTRDRT